MFISNQEELTGIAVQTVFTDRDDDDVLEFRTDDLIPFEGELLLLLLLLRLLTCE